MLQITKYTFFESFTRAPPLPLNVLFPLIIIIEQRKSDPLIIVYQSKLISKKKKIKRFTKIEERLCAQLRVAVKWLKKFSSLNDELFYNRFPKHGESFIIENTRKRRWIGSEFGKNMGVVVSFSIKMKNSSEKCLPPWRTFQHKRHNFSTKSFRMDICFWKLPKIGTIRSGGGREAGKVEEINDDGRL